MSTASLTEEPEVVAARLRDLLGVKRTEAASWRNVYDAFNRWRGALEEAGVLVFQAEDVEVSEIRGFSLSERLFPAVVVNIKDAVVGRTFSMLHEATHLMLREGGLCDLLEETSRAQERIEAFCNHVAGATLMPGAWMLEEDVVRQHKGTQWADEEIALLPRSIARAGRRWSVVSSCWGRPRRTSIGRSGSSSRRSSRRSKRKPSRRRPWALEAGGFAPPDRMAVSTAGPFFVRLVLDSYHQEKITANELSSFLEIRLKHVPKIEHAVLARSAASGAHV